MTPEERRRAKAAKDRADYDARKMEKARQAGIKARTAEEAKAWAAKREAEQAAYWRERDALDRERRRLDNERWRREAEKREAQRCQDAANMADARASQTANGPERPVCRLDVSSGVRCWFLPGHEGRCLPEPPRPVKGRIGATAAIILAVALGAW